MRKQTKFIHMRERERERVGGNKNESMKYKDVFHCIQK